MRQETGFADALMAWQRHHGRHNLPWQASRDPYRVWLSEIMLQQTQVSTVIAYYARFIERFPDVASLAAATLDEVLALWSGLGYYSRARSLHRCAQQVMAEHAGRFPETAPALAELPGIGRSTAAAIAVFCFGQREAILDGNVKRVLTRWLGFDTDLAGAAAQRDLWARAEALVPEQGADIYTQGLMDLGATLCTARRPRCEACPVSATCVALAQGQPERYPVKGRRPRRGERSHALLLLTHGDRVWLVQRPAEGVWGGLWSLPEFDDEQALATVAGAWPGETVALPLVRHVLTHFDWALQPCWHRLPWGQEPLATLSERWPNGRWVPAGALTDWGLPAPVRGLIERLLASGGPPAPGKIKSPAPG